MKCELCGKEISEKEAHNGRPLVEGHVCPNCNWKVVRERLRLSKEAEDKHKKGAEESVAVIGTDGPISTIDPISDFEKYAKQFEETFILGKEPVRKEEPKNSIKESNGEFTGEVKSIEKEKTIDPPELIKNPEKEDKEQQKENKSATEGYGVHEFNLFLKLGKELGLKTMGEVQDLVNKYSSSTPISALLEEIENMEKSKEPNKVDPKN